MVMVLLPDGIPFGLPFHICFENQRNQGQQRQERSDGKGGGELVLVIENFNVQRHGVRLAANVAGDNRHRAELAHCAGVAEDDAIQQRPFDVRQRDAPERLQARCPKCDRGFFFVAALRLHQRDEFARHEWKRHEDRGQDDAGNGKNDPDVVVLEPAPEPSMAPNTST